MQYTLVGFYAELDWRPLNFLESLPADKVCSACGVVRPHTVLLPCAHTLCASCYEQCADQGVHLCPLDGYACHTKDVHWREFSAVDLFRYKVKCWNEANGCQCVTAAYRIAQHFHSECVHHPVHCPLCSDAVPCCNVISHLRDCFRDTATPPTSEAERQPGYGNATTSDSSVKGTFRKQVEEASEDLQQLLTEMKGQEERLEEISQAIKDLKESEEHDVMVDVGERHDSCTPSMSEMDATSQDTHNFFGSLSKLEINDEMADVGSETRGKLSETDTVSEAGRAAAQQDIEFSQKTVDHIKTILRHIELGKVLCVFSVKHVNSLQETAMKTGVAKYESKQVYLRGYNVAPGVLIMKHGGAAKLYALIRLYKGNMDNVLRWPFQHKIKFGIMHPTNRADLVFEVKGNPSFHYFQRPPACSNSSTYFARQSINVESLVRDGYVENDQLRAMFELLP